VEQYHRDLIDRLETSKPWTLTDTKWAWNRFASTGPAGERYLKRFDEGFHEPVAMAPETAPVRP